MSTSFSKRNLMARREVLKSALGGLLLAPLLRQRDLQAANANPKRLILVFTPDSHPPEWWPTGKGRDFALQTPLKDFEDLKKHLLFVRRLDHSWTYDNHHVAGIVQLFTGCKFNNDTEKYANGPSLDHYLLQNAGLQGGTPRAQLAVGVDDGRSDQRHIISYSGSGQPVTPEVDPSRAFKNAFGNVTFGGTATPAPTSTAPAAMPSAVNSAKPANADAKIVEVSVNELKYMQRFLGKEEKDRLELHVEGLQALKKRIDGMGAAGGMTPSVPLEPVVVGGMCSKPDTSGFAKSQNDAKKITRWSDINIDLIANAFTCDITRAATFQFSFSGGHHEGLLGYPASWHDDIAHVSNDTTVTVGGSSITTRAAFGMFSGFWSGHVARLARKLASISEGDGTMLDNTLIYWGVESGTNHNHSPADMQYLLIGGKNLGFQTGQFLDVSKQSAHRLHVSVLNAFGAPVESFGTADNGKGALPGVLG